MLLALVISIPIYVCASSSTPIVASLFTKGLVPGAAVILLLAGPATNSSTMLAAKQMFGNKGAVGYSLGITLTSIMFGLLVQTLFPNLGEGVLVLKENEHAHIGFINNIAAVTILLLLTSKFLSLKIKLLYSLRLQHRHHSSLMIRYLLHHQLGLVPQVHLLHLVLHLLDTFRQILYEIHFEVSLLHL